MNKAESLQRANEHVAKALIALEEAESELYADLKKLKAKLAVESTLTYHKFKKCDDRGNCTETNEQIRRAV